MFKEIKEQPELIRKISKKYLIEDILCRWKVPKKGKIIITGMGSSLFAAYPAYLRLLDHGYPVVWIDASELLHYGLNSIKKEDTLICISQSGESFEVVEVIKRYPNFNRIIGFTAQTRSTMGELCSETIDILSGTEESITSTKAHTATLALLNLLSLSWISAQNEISELHSLLDQLADEIEEVIENSESWCNNLLDELDIIQPSYHKVIIARGPALSSAWHGNLCFSECAKELFAVFSAGQFRHGPYELAVDPLLAIIFSLHGKTQKLTSSLAQELIQKEVQILLVGEKEFSFSERSHRFKFLPIHCNDEYFAPMIAIVYLQIIAYYAAIRKGIEPGTAQIVSKMTLKE